MVCTCRGGPNVFSYVFMHGTTLSRPQPWESSRFPETGVVQAWNCWVVVPIPSELSSMKQPVSKGNIASPKCFQVVRNHSIDTRTGWTPFGPKWSVTSRTCIYIYNPVWGLMFVPTKTSSRHMVPVGNNLIQLNYDVGNISLQLKHQYTQTTSLQRTGKQGWQ